jgi:uncharacterized protein YukE
MAEAYEVGTPALTNHARTLADLAGELSSALTAGEVTVTADAYGQTGARFAAALNGVAAAGQDTLRAGIDALSEAAQLIRDTATAYQQQEDAAGERFTTISVQQP